MDDKKNKRIKAYNKIIIEIRDCMLIIFIRMYEIARLIDLMIKVQQSNTSCLSINLSPSSSIPLKQSSYN